MNYVVACDGSWWCFDALGCTETTRNSSLPGRGLVCWHPLSAVAGLDLFQGSPRYASHQIARRVREQGLVDGDCHVLIHHLRRRGADYQVLYTAAAKAEWVAMQEWIAAQQQPLKVVPLMDLMLSRCKPQSACLMLCRNQLYFLARLGEGTLFASATMFSTETSDLEAAVALLMSKVADDAPGFGIREIPVKLWIAAGQVGPIDTAEALKRALSGYQVQMSAAVANRRDLPEAAVISSIPELLRDGAGLRSIGDLKSRGAWAGDRWFSLTVPAFALLVGGLMAQTHSIWIQQEEQQQQAAAALAQADVAEAQLRDLALPPPNLEVSARDQVRFLGDLERAMSKPDILHVVRSIESAAGGRVKITAVRSVDVRQAASKPGVEPPRKQEVVVEGEVPKVDGIDRSVVLSEFLRSLGQFGYEAQPATVRATTVASEDRFAYQLKRSGKGGA